ncbi:hypothetical protein D3C81_97750 [compost metagenome]
MSGALLSGWRYRAFLLSIAMGAAGYLAFSLWGGLPALGDAAARVGVAGAALMLALSLLNYGLRFCRWQRYLRAMGHDVPWRASARIYLAGFALTVTPGKAGEALRGVLLARLGVPHAHSLAALLSERLSDLLAIICLALFGLSQYPPLLPLVAAASAAALAGVWLLTRAAPARWLAAWSTARPGDPGLRLRALAGHLARLLRQAQACHAPRLLAPALALSLAAWAAEALAFYCLLQWLDAGASLPFAALAFAGAMLAGALSFLPAGLGGMEAAMVSLLLWQGMAPAQAVAATILIRLTTLWFAVALGVAALSSSRGPQAQPS